MPRFIPALALAGAVLCSAPAFAADYLEGMPGGFRDGYKADWDMSDAGDPLDFEFGTRYWYSMGRFNMNSASDSFSTNDTGHVLELYGRIDDNSTATYLKGIAGYSVALNSDYNTSGATGSSEGGQVYYAGADFGYLGLGNENFGFGGFVGYQFQNDSPFTGRHLGNTTNINYNMLRLGLAARANLGDQVDLTAEAAIIPYARVDGQLAMDPTVGASSGGSLEGTLYGAAGEVMLGFHPTDNMTIRGGGRAWYLTGPANVAYTPSGGGAETPSSFSLFRFGALAELTYAF